MFVLKSRHKKEIDKLLHLLGNAADDRDRLENSLGVANDVITKLKARLATYKGQFKNQYDKGYGDGYDTGILEGYCSDDNKTGYLENLYTRLSKINKFNKTQAQAELRAELLRIGFTGPYEIERAQKHVHNLIRFIDARYRHTSKEISFKK